MKRIAFGLLEIGKAFNYPGSEVIMLKVSDFTARVIDTPEPIYDNDYPQFSVINGQIGTPDLVDTNKEIHQLLERLNHG